MSFDTPTAKLRTMAYIEGVSYLLLLGIAMPLKYVWDLPIAVRILGSVHGLLFVWLAWLTWVAIQTRGKSYAWGARLGIASLIPFGTFFFDGELRRDDEEYRARAGTDATES